MSPSVQLLGNELIVLVNNNVYMTYIDKQEISFSDMSKIHWNNGLESWCIYMIFDIYKAINQLIQNWQCFLLLRTSWLLSRPPSLVLTLSVWYLASDFVLLCCTQNNKADMHMYNMHGDTNALKHCYTCKCTIHTHTQCADCRTPVSHRMATITPSQPTFNIT